MIDIEIEDEAWREALPDAEALAQTAAAAALAGQHEHKDTDVVVLLADDASVRELNARFRGQDKATNVLSFPASPTAIGYLGDIALAFGVCAHEAAEQEKSLANHLQHLVVHGVLHLLGYDHLKDRDAGAMEAAERDILAGLGVPDPYQ